MPLTTEQKREKYHRDRRHLTWILGGKCVDCGSKENLEFDHIEPRTWDAKKASRWTRLKKYQEEADQGLIELRCADCNKKKGQPPTNTPEEELPE